MIFLSLSATEITAIIGALATVFTVFIIPTIRWYKKIKKTKKENIKKQEDRDKMLTSLYDKVVNVEEKIKDQTKLKEAFDNYLQDYDEFTTQNIKYMINDAFFGYSNIHEIPDDVLTNACECCEIYVNKKKKNHEIRPRCMMLWEEQERRATNREVHNE